MGSGIILTTVDGHTTLIEFLAITKYILAHLTKVKIEVTSIISSSSFLTCVNKRIEQPELNIFNIGLFEIVGIYFAHHSSPLGFWVKQTTIAIQREREVVRSTLLWIVCKIKYWKRRGSAVISALVTIRIELFYVHLAHIVVRQLIKIALDMGRRQSRTAAGEDWVYIIPCQQGSIIAAGDTCLIATLCKHRWHTRQRPLLRITHIEIALGILEIIHIRSIILSATGSAGNKLCELTSKRYVRRLLYVQERYLVKHRCEPLRLLFPVDIQSPDGVAQRFFAHVNLRCKCLLVKMHDCTTNLQTLRQLVLPVESQHRFALHAIFGIRLERYTYVGTSIYDALIQDCNLTCRVIHRVIRTLVKHNSTSRYYHRTTRNIICAKRNDIGRRAFVLTYQHILILLGHELSNGLCTIVQFAENILLCLRYGKATVNQLFAQISSKRLG